MKIKEYNKIWWFLTSFLCLETLIIFLLETFVSMPFVLSVLSGTFFVIAVFWLIVRKYIVRVFLDEDTVKGTNDRSDIDLKHVNTKLQSVTRMMRKQIYDLHNLFEVSINLTSILEPQKLLRSSILPLIGQLRTNQAMIFIITKKDPRRISPVYMKGFAKEGWDDFSISLEDPLLKKFHMKMVPINLIDVNENLLNENWKKLIEDGMTLIAPIIHRREIKGIVGLGQKMDQEYFSQSEKEIFGLLTHFISVAFSNSILYQKVEFSAITDELTGLYNYRYFKRRLYHEINRAKRYGHALSLILLDVDNFKNYNDKLGHPAGDRALKKVAELIKTSTRKSDIAVRYGGEEFCIILPMEDIQAAKQFGERLRKKIETYEFYKREVQPAGKVTVSLGAASFPEDTGLMQDLIDKADAALYHAKHLGRNMICLYYEKVMDGEKNS
ncbi:MAG TPA: sensor domain-containing diguanylate cyclase [Spirochaetes bacterium]|nr:sensor domain-containing diguanylate cyclase [Spirochaetota bacterium]